MKGETTELRRDGRGDVGDLWTERRQDLMAASTNTGNSMQEIVVQDMPRFQHDQIDGGWYHLIR